MKKNYIKYISVGVFLFVLQIIFSCNSKKNRPVQVNNDAVSEVLPTLKGGSIFERFSKNNFSYCYYIPGDFKGEEKFPVIIFLDPHGNGRE